MSADLEPSVCFWQKVLFPFPGSPPESLGSCLAGHPPGSHPRSGGFSPFACLPGRSCSYRCPKFSSFRRPCSLHRGKGHLRVSGILEKAQKWASVPTASGLKDLIPKWDFQIGPPHDLFPEGSRTFHFVCEKGVVPPTYRQPCLTFGDTVKSKWDQEFGRRSQTTGNANVSLFPFLQNGNKYCVPAS